MFKKPISRKAAQFTESVIREMTRLALEHGAVNLSQGFPDFPAPEILKKAASNAVLADVNQYAITWGAKNFRDAIAEKTKRFMGIDIDPETEITVACGATEAMMNVLMAIIDPGDEVIVFEPFYENYGPDAIISGATPRYVQLHHPDGPLTKGNWRPSSTSERRPSSSTRRTTRRARCFRPKNWSLLRAFARSGTCWPSPTRSMNTSSTTVLAMFSMITIEGMRDRTVVVNSMSKTYSVTGWRVGYSIAPPRVADAIRKMHDFITVGAAAPLQEAGVVAMQLPPSYYDELAESYRKRRDRMLQILKLSGFDYIVPKGAYYVMSDISNWDYPDDVEFCRFLVTEVGVAAVPGSSFFEDPAAGKDLIRFTFLQEGRNNVIGRRASELGQSQDECQIEMNVRTISSYARQKEIKHA